VNDSLKQILFIDIETAPCYPTYTDMPVPLQDEWNRKAKTFKNANNEQPEPAVAFSERAGIYSEFAKVVCIGIGSFFQHTDGWQLKLKALTGEDEHELLTEFCTVVNKFSDYVPAFRFCGHNIKEFDVPFLCRRMVIQGIMLPECMQIAGKKPWEVPHLDTLELWKFGDNKNYTTLSLLAQVLGIPSPKSDLDGSKVGQVYWGEKDLARIGKYCLQDVLTTVKVYLRLKGTDDLGFQTVYA
jgi:3'-5' exonuclease